MRLGTASKRQLSFIPYIVLCFHICSAHASYEFLCLIVCSDAEFATKRVCLLNSRPSVLLEQFIPTKMVILLFAPTEFLSQFF